MKRILIILLFFFIIWQIKSPILTSQAQAGPEIPGGAWIAWIDPTKLTDNELQYIARHYDIYRAQPNTLTKEQIARLHQLNPNLIIIPYMSHSAVCAKRNWEPLVEEHPEWWLRSTQIAENPEEENGENKIVTWETEGCKVLKPNLPATRWFIWGLYKEQLAKGYDGIYGDISGPGVWGSNFQPKPQQTPIIDPDPDRGGNYTNEEWITDQISRLKFLKTQLNEKFPDQNIHLWNPIPYHWDNYYSTKHFWTDSESDGAQFDGFLNNREIGKENWKGAVNILADAIRTEQIILVKTKNLKESLAEREKIKTFSFASYLLALKPKNDRSAYFCHCYDRENELSSLVEDTRPQLEIGKPIQNSDQSGKNYVDGFEISGYNSYRRNFEYGTVLVNPTGSKDENINLGSVYYDGAIQVSKTNLPAYSAKILTTTPQKKISLSQGWNQITWSDISGYTTKSALEGIDNDCGAETVVAITRKRKDWWEEYIRGYGGEEFALNNGVRYFIKAIKACEWTP